MLSVEPVGSRFRRSLAGQNLRYHHCQVGVGIRRNARRHGTVPYVGRILVALLVVVALAGCSEIGDADAKADAARDNLISEYQTYVRNQDSVKAAVLDEVTIRSTSSHRAMVDAGRRCDEALGQFMDSLSASYAEGSVPSDDMRQLQAKLSSLEEVHLRFLEALLEMRPESAVIRQRELTDLNAGILNLLLGIGSHG